VLTAALIANRTAQEQQRERAARPKPAPTKETLALLADLVLKQSEGGLPPAACAWLHLHAGS
jgi:hypothetical protein